MGTDYKCYFESLPGYVTVHDRDYRVIDANERFRAHFGDWEGRHCYQVYKQRSEPCENCVVDRTFHDEQPHSSEEKVLCVDGREVQVITYTTPIRDDKGEVCAVMEMSTDITQIKKLQRRLKESQERYRLLFEEVPCYISIQDRELRIVEANRRFREDFDTRLGCRCWETYKGLKEQCFPCPVQKTFDDGLVHTSEEVVTSKHGQTVNTLVYTAPIYGEDGRIEYVMEMSANVTPIRQLQSQLESMGIIISSISHGIKGLLTGLDGGTYLVNSGMQKDKPQRVTEGWEMVQRNIERIRSMVMNILYYAKEREPNWESIDATAVARDCLKGMESKASSEGVALESEIADAGLFEADPQAVRALLINLLDNSVDACIADKRKNDHKVKLVVRSSNNHVEFQVEDNGIGMDREMRGKAFTPFFSSKGIKGTGLGLFISGNIARKHGGTIELDSEEGRGTRFLVKLPRERANMETAA